MRKTSLVLALAMSAIVVNAQDHKPDNTAVNKEDRHQGQQTADQQKENSRDLDLAKNVRRALVKDKALSTYAHNVKVISESGIVTLKGPVRSEEEKRAVEAKAAEVAGAGNIKSEITVAPKHE
jgi:hyperosmotically inducible protein